MQVMIAAVGSPGDPHIGEAVRRYEERASRYFRLRVVEVRAAALPDAEADRARETESRRLLDRIPGDLELFALTRRGKAMSSAGLARYLGELATYGRPGAAFAVGGAHGLSEEILARARYRLSLSPMTLPHALARLVLTEQIYRAGTILRGEPYHKGNG